MRQPMAAGLESGSRRRRHRSGGCPARFRVRQAAAHPPLTCLLLIRGLSAPQFSPTALRCRSGALPLLRRLHRASGCTRCAVSCTDRAAVPRCSLRRWSVFTVPCKRREEACRSKFNMQHPKNIVGSAIRSTRPCIKPASAGGGAVAAATLHLWLNLNCSSAVQDTAFESQTHATPHNFAVGRDTVLLASQTPQLAFCTWPLLPAARRPLAASACPQQGVQTQPPGGSCCTGTIIAKLPSCMRTSTGMPGGGAPATAAGGAAPGAAAMGSPAAGPAAACCCSGGGCGGTSAAACCMARCRMRDCKGQGQAAGEPGLGAQSTGQQCSSCWSMQEAPCHAL